MKRDGRLSRNEALGIEPSRASLARLTLEALALGITVITFGGLVGCAAGGGARTSRPPGLYDGPGFGCPSSISCDNTTLGAYVGIPVTWETFAGCRGGRWSYRSVEISSGALPPGLRIGVDSKGETAIVGVPERAGTWHLQMRFDGVTCAGESYGSQTQTLHITTVGSSAPRQVR